jgi:hypothetical protein
LNYLKKIIEILLICIFRFLVSGWSKRRGYESMRRIWSEGFL